MKRFFFVIAVLMSIVSSYAQDNTYGGGYRGFADLGYTIGVGDYDFGRFEISTTHGYQVNPYFFVGGGVGFHFMESYKTVGMEYALDERKSKVSIPLFADFRGTFSKRKFAPFVDLKLGSSLLTTMASMETSQLVAEWHSKASKASHYLLATPTRNWSLRLLTASPVPDTT